MSVAGTAYEGTTRRGSQSIRARVVLTMVSSPTVALTHFSTGWTRSSSSALMTRVCICTAMEPSSSGSRRLPMVPAGQLKALSPVRALPTTRVWTSVVPS